MSDSKIPWNRVNSKQPKVPQIKSQIKFMVNQGYFKPGDQLPAAHHLGELVNASKRTVEEAYRELRASGLLKRVFPNKTIVQRPPLKAYSGTPPLAAFKFNEPFPDTFWPVFTESFLKLGSNSARKVVEHSLVRTQKKMTAIMRTASAQGTDAALARSIIEILANRKIVVSVGQFCLIEGLGRNLNVVVLALLSKGDGVVLTSPYDRRAVASFQLQDVNLFFTGVDESGMDIIRLEEICKREAISAVYIRPAEDYPTCTAVSPARRQQILYLAELYNFVVIEMYKEHEFWPNEEPISFWEMGAHHRTIYLSSISRMSPDLNVKGVVVGPPDFISKVESIANKYGKKESDSDALLIKLVEEDTFSIYTEKALEQHRKLQDDMLFLISNYLPKNRFIFSRAGWAVWIRLHKPVDPAPLIPRLKELGLWNHPAQIGPCDSVQAILLGYGSNSIHEIEEGLKYLSSLKILSLALVLTRITFLYPS